MKAHELAPGDVKQMLSDGREIAFLDMREAGQYGEGHPFLAVNLPYSGLEELAAALLPRLNVRIVLLDDGGPDLVAERAAARLAALGYEDISILAGGAPAWAAAGYTLFKGVNVPSKALGELVEANCHTPHISAAALKAQCDSGARLLLLDGRSPEEYGKFTIPGAISCPNAELAMRLPAMGDETTPVVVNCAGRTRSIIGAQSLRDLGLPNPVMALENGTQGWRLAGYELEHDARRKAPELVNPEYGELANRRAWQAIDRHRLPVVDFAGLDRWIGSEDRTLYMFDVRSKPEFDAGHFAGCRHAPGGQLVQATDQWVAVRGARIALFDDTLLRAAFAALWLRRMGHDAYVFTEDASEAGVPAAGMGASGASERSRIEATLPLIDAAELRMRAYQHVRLLDIRPGLSFRAGHLEIARWAIRPCLGQLGLVPGNIVYLLAERRETAELVAHDLRELGISDIRLNLEGPEAWRKAGLDIVETPMAPSDAECIDHLFFVHDRHAGNLEAARAYLAWETGLLDQLDEQERAIFAVDATAPAG